MRFGVLGPLEVQDGGKPIAVARTRERALLSLLIINANRLLTDEAIVAALWGDNAPRNPKAALQTAVSRLRTALDSPPPESILERRGEGYLLRVDPAAVDALRFEQLVSTAETTADPTTGVALLEEALALWRGSAYADVRFEEYAQPEIRRLNEIRIEARELRIANKMELGEYQAVVADLESLVFQHPLRESLWGKLMLSLYRCDRHTEALRMFQRARTAIGEATGLEPGAELTRLEEEILMHSVPPDSGTSLPAEPAEGPYPTNLSEALTTFVGREHDLETLGSLFESKRLISLVGPAGVGKTRLALEVAQRIRDDYPGGAYFVALDKVGNTEHLIDVATAAVSLPERPVTDARMMLDVLRSKRSLVILDNCEHMLDATAEFADRLLRDTSTVTILTTSRQRLGTELERVWHVQPLSLHLTESDSPSATIREPALQLYVDRIAAVRPDLDTGDSDLLDAGRIITSALDGLPLAIELAASQSFALSPQAIARQLEDQLGLPASRNPLVADRHQTLEAAVEWSLRLLDAQHRRCFTAVSVIPESFGVDAVEAVCPSAAGSDTLTLLTDLVEQSLVEQVASPSGERRFRLLGPIRTAARRVLEDEGTLFELQRRYAAWLAERAHGWYREMNSPGHRRVRRQVIAERWNLLATIDWALEHEPETALPLLAGPRYLWVTLGNRWNAIRGLQLALAVAPERTHERVDALNNLAFLSSVSLSPTAFTRRTSRSEIPALVGDTGSPQPEDVAELDGYAAAVEATQIAQELGDAGLVAFSQFRQGFSFDLTEEAAEAEQLLTESTAAMNALGLGSETASALAALSRLKLAAGDYAEARRYAEQTYAMREPADHLTGQLSALDLLARVERSQGHYQEALEHYRHALDVIANEGFAPPIVAYVHTEIAYLAMNLHDPEAATRELGLALAAARATGHRRMVAGVRLAQAQLAIDESQLDAAHGYLEEALSVFEQSNDNVAMAYTLGLWGLLQHLRSDRLGAAELFIRSIEVQRGQHDPIALARSLEGLAALASRAGDFSRAALLLGIADTQRTAGRCPRGHWHGFLDFAEIGLSAEDYESSLAEGREMTLAEAFAYVIPGR
ncbi:MAG: BTAD domain-containing putative transcriptional regulator [Acidimicrobiia bacterium]|nr:BTAD domain-containing putative transcriptional regulator [Acidimicrobiia bacterium]